MIYPQSIALVFIVLIAVAGEAAEEHRLDFYARDGQRQGYATIDRDTGRVDLYDKDGRRTGYGLTRDERLELVHAVGARNAPSPMAPLAPRPASHTIDPRGAS